MQSYHINHTLYNMYIMANGMFSHTSIDLAHGLLFALHCDNEQPQDHDGCDESNLTFLNMGELYLATITSSPLDLPFALLQNMLR